MKVGSANRSRRDPNERGQRTYFRNRFLIENDAAGLDKHCCFRFHRCGPLFNARFI
jgi:hypothetical protein